MTFGKKSILKENISQKKMESMMAFSASLFCGGVFGAAFGALTFLSFWIFFLSSINSMKF